jgi:hypothetical protein
VNPKLTRIQRNIMTLYGEDPNVVNDDAVLFDRYWHRFDGADDSKSLHWNLTKCTRPETISRRRRELHVAELIKYSGEADKTREEAFVSERDLHSKAIYVGLDR